MGRFLYFVGPTTRTRTPHGGARPTNGIESQRRQSLVEPGRPFPLNARDGEASGGVVGAEESGCDGVPTRHAEVPAADRIEAKTITSMAGEPRPLLRTDQHGACARACPSTTGWPLATRAVFLLALTLEQRPRREHRPFPPGVRLTAQGPLLRAWCMATTPTRQRHWRPRTQAPPIPGPGFGIRCCPLLRVRTWRRRWPRRAGSPAASPGRASPR